jgi:ABC-type lipoprotein export system ATPase subunit
MMLEARKVRKFYNDGLKEIQVLKSLDFKVVLGSFVAIVGPSGAGKSTLLHILGGLDVPTQGQVFFDGEDIYRLNDAALSKIRNERVGFVFQFYHLLPEFTVRENVLMPSLIRAQGNKALISQASERAENLLKRVGLAERMGHFPSQLSGGEQQRAAIVRALINQPSVLLCDEPTGNLDSQSGGEIVSLIKEINKENRMTTVMVTHNLEIAKSADKVYHLKDGVMAQ